MANLIDTSYFVGDINIPNAGTGGPVDALVLQMIKNRESEFLRLALGRSLYRAFVTALGLASDGSTYANVTSGKAADDVEQRFKDLLNGKEYTALNNRLHKWRGFISLSDDGQNLKQSLIASYVYFYFIRVTATQSTGSGEVTTKKENATGISPRFKMATIWNQMGEEIKELLLFLKSNTDVYSEWHYRDGQEALEEFDHVNPIF